MLLSLPVTNRRRGFSGVAVEKTTLAANPEEFLGGFKAYFEMDYGKYQRPHVSATWRLGFFDTIRLGAGPGLQVGGKGLDTVGKVETLIDVLPTLPSARFLRSLVLGPGRYETENHYDVPIKRLIKLAPTLGALRELHVADFTYEDSELSWSKLGNVNGLFRAFPKLRKLKLRGADMNLGTIAAPELEDFAIETTGLTKANLTSIVEGKFPKLKSLSLWIGSEDHGANVRAKDLVALLNAPWKLSHLGLKNFEWGDELCELLPKSKMLAKLSSLDLSMSHISAKGVKALLANKAAFKGLESLDLSKCLLTKTDERAVKVLAKNVNTEKQSNFLDDYAEEAEDEEDPFRYVAVSE